MFSGTVPKMSPPEIASPTRKLSGVKGHLVRVRARVRVRERG